MNIYEYEKTLTGDLQQATLVFLRRDDEILLAMKKRGFGKGKWNGLGGKLNPGESVEEAAKREANEESDIEIETDKLKKVARIKFYFPHIPTDQNWNQEVTAFLCDTWQGDPVETEEMKPQWTKINEIPYDQMWPDDIVWLPLVLEGKLIEASFAFSPDEKIKDYYLNVVPVLK